MRDKRFHILVADDEPIERMVVSKTLQNHYGDEVVVSQAANGRKAVEVVSRMRCQIALLDISMPGIDGLEAAEMIRGENPLCSIIFLTAHDEFDYAKRAIRVRALDYLLKPWSKEELIAVMDEAIHIAQENKENRQDLREEQPQTETAHQTSLKNQVQVEAVKRFLEEHYMEDICLQDAAASLHYSDVYFCRFFKQNFEKNFIMYLSELRVEKAKKLLTDVTVNVREVSKQVGYRDSGYFTKVFKRITGETPSEYRNARIAP